MTSLLLSVLDKMYMIKAQTQNSEGPEVEFQLWYLVVK